MNIFLILVKSDVKSMSKYSKTPYFYFFCRCEFWNVPGASGNFLRYSSSNSFWNFLSVFLLHCHFLSFKVVGILLCDCRPIMKKLSFLRHLTHASDMLVRCCWCFALMLLLLLFWDCSALLVPELVQTLWRFCRCRWWHIVPFVLVNCIYLASLAIYGSWLLKLAFLS